MITAINKQRSLQLTQMSAGLKIFKNVFWAHQIKLHTTSSPEHWNYYYLYLKSFIYLFYYLENLSLLYYSLYVQSSNCKLNIPTDLS